MTGNVSSQPINPAGCAGTWEIVVQLYRGEHSYPSSGFLEADEVGLDLVLLHGASFTLPSGLFPPLERGETSHDHLDFSFKSAAVMHSEV